MFDIYILGLFSLFWYQIGFRYGRPKDKKGNIYSVVLIAMFWPFSLACVAYWVLKNRI